MKGIGKQIGMIMELVEIVIAYASVQVVGLYFLSKLYMD